MGKQLTGPSLKLVAALLFGGVVLLFLIYAGALLWFIWPIDARTLDRAGVFGDSFGVLTSLFSALAFSGLILTILMQREELQEQRKEIALQREQTEISAQAQMESSRAQRDRLEMEKDLVQRQLSIGLFDEWNSPSMLEVRRSLGALSIGMKLTFRSYLTLA